MNSIQERKIEAFDKIRAAVEEPEIYRLRTDADLWVLVRREAMAVEKMIQNLERS